MKRQVKSIFTAMAMSISAIAAAQNEAVVSYLEIYDLETRTHKVVKEFDGTVEAPNWTPDGQWIVLNTGGKLYKLSAAELMAGNAGTPLVEIPTIGAVGCNNDHVISADGKWIGLSAHDGGPGWNSYVFVVPFEGGEAKKLTPIGPSYLHGISPDGKNVAYCAFRQDENGETQMEVISCAVKQSGKKFAEKMLTKSPGLDDGPEYSPDGKYIWFNSVRSGMMQAWRMKKDGSEQTQMTFDPKMNAWFPHVSPDGKQVVYIAYHDYEIDPGQHLPNLNVQLRLMPAEGGEPEVLTELFGGQGTINVNSWAPDSKKFAYISYRIKNEMTAPKKNMNVQLYSIRKLIGSPELFAKNGDYVLTRLAQMGYTGVEAASYANGKFSGMEPAEFTKFVEAHGLKVVSSHMTRFLSDEQLASGDISEAVEFWRQVVADHKAAGIPYLVMAMERGQKSIHDLAVLVSLLNKIGEMCNEAGIRFGYHSHSHEFAPVEGTTMMDYMIQNTDPAKVFFEMDVYWADHALVSPVEYMKKYPGRYELLHIKDLHEIGQSGMMGFDAIFSNFGVAGTKDYVVEMEGASTPNDLKGLRESALYLRYSDFVKESYK